MKMTAILKSGIKVLLTSLVVFGVFAVVANAQPNQTRKIAFKVDKKKFAFQSSKMDLPAGKLIVGGTVQGVEVSGGKGGCYDITVTVYRLTPNGTKIPIRSRTKKVCLFERLPDLIVDFVPRGQYLIEVGVDRPLINEEKFAGDLTVTVQPERINRP
jgi:2-keto-4-pentenoate hydratase/2-oxohepta-3-ene-1,7-dioic acid hydratase in catechol pathway